MNWGASTIARKTDNNENIAKIPGKRIEKVEFKGKNVIIKDEYGFLKFPVITGERKNPII